MLGPWHSWGGKVLRLAPKPDPLIYDCLPNSAACFPALLAKSQELPVTQLARHVDLFYLVVTDNRRPETLSLPHGLAPPIKPTTDFSLSRFTLHPKRVTALQSGSNKSFFSTHGVVFVRQFLTSRAKIREMLTGCSGPGLLPWPLCPALSQTQTAELTPCASGLWILDLTALPAFPSIISLSLPLLST
jgi:hypothetical protein